MCDALHRRIAHLESQLLAVNSQAAEELRRAEETTILRARSMASTAVAQVNQSLSDANAMCDKLRVLNLSLREKLEEVVMGTCVCLSVCLSVWSVCLSVCLSVWSVWSVCLSVACMSGLSVCLCVCLSVCLSVCLYSLPSNVVFLNAASPRQPRHSWSASWMPQ